MAEKPTVFVIDADDAFRHQVKDLLERSGFHVEEYASAPRYLESCRPDQTGCLVVGDPLPEMDVLEFHRQLVEKGCDHPFIVINGHNNVERAVEVMKQGAADFLTRPVSPGKLVMCVQANLQSDEEARSHRERKAAIDAAVEALSPRQREVFELLLQGKNTKEIAQELNISLSTVENHRGRVLEKLQVPDVVNLVRLILETELC